MLFGGTRIWVRFMIWFHSTFSVKTLPAIIIVGKNFRRYKFLSPSQNFVTFYRRTLSPTKIFPLGALVRFWQNTHSIRLEIYYNYGSREMVNKKRVFVVWNWTKNRRTTVNSWKRKVISRRQSLDQDLPTFWVGGWVSLISWMKFCCKRRRI